MYDTEWFTLEKKTVKLLPGHPVQEFYSVSEGDHVTVVAEDFSGNILLVRQYRPAVEAYTLELPGGHVENDDPETSARCELTEETGFSAEIFHYVGKMILDSGRNQGFVHVYYAAALVKTGTRENNIEIIPVSKENLQRLISEGAFSHSLNLGAILLAMIKGFLTINEKRGKHLGISTR